MKDRDRLYCRPGIRDTTAGTYEHSIYKLIIPRIGDWKLHEITPGKLDLYVAELLEKGKRNSEIKTDIEILRSYMRRPNR